MPQLGQINPNHLHPHTMVVINDNTEFQDVAAPAEEGIRGLFVFTSPKGRDGVILQKTSSSQLVKEYGKPNFKLFGQPQYNAYGFLEGGRAKAWCMRVMPEDAALANVAIVAKVKTEGEQLIVRYEAVQHQELLSADEVDAVTDLLATDVADLDGFVTLPLMTFYSLGRGVYGDAFRVRLSGSVQADKENDFRNYRLEVLELENSLNRKEVFSGTVFPDALDGSTSLYLGDVVSDSEKGSQSIGVHISDENFTALYNMYKDLNPTTEITEEEFSVLTATVKGSTSAIPGLQIDTTGDNTIALDNPEGIPFGGGSDGAFTYDVNTLADRETAMDAAYSKAFRGEFDRGILSKRRTPAEVILDAAYSDEVKRELISLITKRYDAYGYVDAGIQHTATDALAWGETMFPLADRVFGKEFQHYKIRDPFTGKMIPVTTTFFIARNIANHFATAGNQQPFVGEDYATLTGAIKNTLKPVVDADDLDLKESLYGLRLNYFETIAENTVVRGTQSTAQTIWSDLSEENNVHVLLEMKRDLEIMVSGLSYDFAESEDRRRFTEDAERLFARFIGTKVRSAEVEFKMSPWEEERSILHCYLAVVYRTMAKRSIVEIDINKRV